MRPAEGRIESAPALGPPRCPLRDASKCVPFFSGAKDTNASCKPSADRVERHATDASATLMSINLIPFASRSALWHLPRDAAGSLCSPHPIATHFGQTKLANRAKFLRNLHAKFFESGDGMTCKFSTRNEPPGWTALPLPRNQAPACHAGRDSRRPPEDSLQPSASFSSVSYERTCAWAVMPPWARRAGTECPRSKSLLRRRDFLLGRGEKAGCAHTRCVPRGLPSNHAVNQQPVVQL